MTRLNRTEEQQIRKIAGFLYKKYCPMGESGFFTKEDIYHYGVIGFMDAKQKYDPSKKVPFAAYAAIRIQGEIMDALRKASQIRLPQEKQARVKELLAAKNELTDQGKPADTKHLMALLGWDEDQLLQVERLLVSVQSTDQNPLLSLTRDKDSREDQEKKVMEKDLSRVMQKCLDGLENQKERLILVARQLKNMKLRQLAEKFNCAIETVRQKEISAKAQMKDCLKKHGWTI
ncbi:MAG: sigma-70 family RNA polymerase sigma factor [Desulfobacterales bacterium]|nr:sigma-70 family RNA polymerase sigma factor [Desulfobacterales bacterium]